MKKILFLLFVSAFTGIASYAQDSTIHAQDSSLRRSHEKDYHHGMQKDKSATYEQLNLTSDQKEKMQKINADFKEKRDKIMNDKSLTDEQRNKQLQSLKMESKKQKAEVLTPEQKAKFKDWRA